ncbi:MAG: VCBS repeat-containing protein [Pirellulaceae bacterium]
MNSNRKSIVEWLESRQLLTAFQFEGNSTLLSSTADAQVITADLNQDDSLDVVVAQANSGRISWFANNGFGQFRDGRLIASLPNVHSLLTADVDRNQALDVIAVSDHQISIFMQDDSETSFYLAANWRSTQPLGRNALFSEDGTTRIVVQHGSSEIAVLSWQLDQTLAVDETILVPGTVSEIQVGLFAGKQGLWVSNQSGDLLRIDRNATDAGFTAPKIAGHIPQAAEFHVADEDDDGQDELVVVMDDEIQAWEWSDTTQQFALDRTIVTGQSTIDSLQLHDFDIDGDLDLVFRSGQQSFVIAESLTDPFGDRSYVEIQSLRASQQTDNELRVADLDQNGGLDLLLWEDANNAATLVAYRNQRRLSAKFEPIKLDASFWDAGDVDGDDQIDVVMSTADGLVWQSASTTPSDHVIHIIDSQPIRLRDVRVGDVDGDGDLDVLGSSYRDHSLLWYENLDSQGTFGDAAVIDGRNRVNHFQLADLDGDGDQDIAALARTGTIAFEQAAVWYENQGEAGFSAPRHIDTGLYSSQQIEVADMDQDQDVDVVITTSLGIQLYKNDGRGGFVGGRVISASPGGSFKGLALDDMNRDGWTDIVAGPIYQNRGFANAFQEIAAAPIGQNFEIADLDSDGVLEIITSHTGIWVAQQDDNGQYALTETYRTGDGRQLAVDRDGNRRLELLGAGPTTHSPSGDSIQATGWYQLELRWLNLERGQPLMSIGNDVVRGFQVSDMDDDHLDDLIAIHGTDVIWMKNPASPNWDGTSNVIASWPDGANRLSVADIDRDGDGDVLVVRETDRSVTILTQQTSTEFAQKQLPLSSSVIAKFAELNADGAADVIGYRLGELYAWFNDGQGEFPLIKQIAKIPDNIADAFSADLDGDGLGDVIVQGPNEAYWIRNQGNQQFEIAQTFTGSASLASEESIIITLGDRSWLYEFDSASNQLLARSVPADGQFVDLDGDGHLEFVANQNQGLTSTSMLTDGAFGRPATLAERGEVAFADWNADGKLDMVHLSPDRRSLTLRIQDSVNVAYYHQDAVRFSTEISELQLGDLDGDQQSDLLFVDADSDMLFWRRNLGQGKYGPEIQISDYRIDDLQDILVADLDGDGDQDLVTGTGDEGAAVWYENIDGSGAFLLRTIYPVGDEDGLHIELNDLDRDGDLDLLVLDEEEDVYQWFENVPDANRFETSHLIPAVELGLFPQMLADVNGDGAADVVGFQIGSGQPGYLPNDGTGGFSTLLEITSSIAFADAVAVDWDWDGDDDFVSVAGQQVLLFINQQGDLGDGAALFQSDDLFPWARLRVEDIDVDGDFDVALWNDRLAAVYLNDNGQFGSPAEITPSRGLVFGDADGNGTVDALSTNGSQVYLSTQQQLHFETAPLDMMGSHLGQLSLGDLNNDGQLDIVSANGGLLQWTSVPSNPLESDFQPISVGSFGEIMVWDVDRDGDQDVVALYQDRRFGSGGQTGPLVWLENRNDGQFQPAQTISDSAIDFGVGDVSGDGRTEIVVIRMDSRNEAVVDAFRKTPAGFERTSLGSLGLFTPRFALGDLDGDGIDDIAYFDSTNGDVGLATWTLRRGMLTLAKRTSGLAT